MRAAGRLGRARQCVQPFPGRPEEAPTNKETRMSHRVFRRDNEHRATRQGPRPSRVAWAVVLLASAAGAAAVELDTGNADLSIRWDNTLRYNLAYRTQDQNAALLASNNFDDGNRNFAKGL